MPPCNNYIRYYTYSAGKSKSILCSGDSIGFFQGKLSLSINYVASGGWQRPLILPLFGFPWSPRLRNLSIIREQQRACAKRAGKNNKKLIFAAIRQCEFVFIILVQLVIAFFRLCRMHFFPAVLWSLRFPFFWSCVCHYMRFTALRTKNETSEHVPRCPTFLLCVSVQKTHKTKRRASPLIRMQKSLYFQVKGPKLILRGIKKKCGGCGRVEELSELFTVLLHL